MYIKKIVLNNFRNYEKLELDLKKYINVFFGNNAVGKTNILESIYFSAITKSYRTIKDTEIIKFNKSYTNFSVEYMDKNSNKNNINIYIDDKIKKIKENGVEIKKLSEHIGKYNIIIFSPESMDIVKGSPKNRRRFMDILISQLSKAYLIKLQEYNKILILKNNLIRSENIDFNYLDILDEKLSEHIKCIVEYRKKIIEKLNDKALKIHSDITSNKEIIDIKYITDFFQMNEVQIFEVLKRNREYDILRKSSTKGIQRDNFEIYINNLEVSTYGSQGQNRTALLTLKLSEFEILKEEKEDEPILLLDDVLSELDNNRISYLFNYIKNYQTIITTTEMDNLINISNISFFKVENGRVEKLEN